MVYIYKRHLFHKKKEPSVLLVCFYKFDGESRFVQIIIVIKILITDQIITFTDTCYDRLS